MLWSLVLIVASIGLAEQLVQLIGTVLHGDEPHYTSTQYIHTDVNEAGLQDPVPFPSVMLCSYTRYVLQKYPETKVLSHFGAL